MGDLTQDFSRKEFECKCGCGKDDINLLLVERLQMIRNALKEPITILSGCRCEKHNKKVGGRLNSAHLTYEAVDVEVLDSGFRYRFLKQVFKIFRRIETPDGGWVHVDVSTTLPQDVCFTK